MTNNSAENLQFSPTERADNALKVSAQLLFFVYTFGLLVFLLYIMNRYGGPVLQDGVAGWNKIAVPHHTDAPSFTLMENISFAAHLLLSFIIFIGGPLQLILGNTLRNNAPIQFKPQALKKARRIHRWIGYTYIPSVILTSLAGLYLTWAPGIPEKYGTGLFAALHVIFEGNSIFAGLTILFAICTVRYAIIGDIARHRRWALRLFVVSGAAFFFRVQIAFWFQLGGEYSELLLTVASYSQSLLGLGLVELYLHSSNKPQAWYKLLATAVLAIAAILLAVGIYAAKGRFF